MNAHTDQMHLGVNDTATQLCQKYWNHRICQQVKVALRNYVPCQKVPGCAYQQPESPPLLSDRLQEPVPFTITGVNFEGMLYAENIDNTTAKRCISLCTCASSRAIHLEIIMNLGEKSFIQAFRRFSSRKSLPRQCFNICAFCMKDPTVNQESYRRN